MGCASGVGLAFWIVALSSISLIACGYCLVCATLGCPCRFACLLVCIVAGAIAGGAILGARSQSASWQRRSEGRSPTFVQFRVVRASQPGWHCRVWLQDGPESQAFVVRLNIDDCPMWEGQRIVLRSDELHSQLVPLSLPKQESEQIHKPPFDADNSRLEPVLRSVWRIEDQGSKYWKTIADLRHRAWIRSRGDRGLSLAFAAALGMPQNIGPEDRQALRKSGMGHLIAVSGLHIGLVGLMLQRLMLRIFISFGQRVGWATVLAWIPTIAYVTLTGASPSAVRAAGMMIVVGLGGILGRPTHGLSVLAMVASLMLWSRPEWILDPSFQFSICAMVALIRSSPCGIVRQSWHISWALAPLCWWHFGEASLWGILVNCLAIPVFAAWVLPWTLIGATLALIGVQEPWGCARLGSEFLLDLAAVVARLPILELSDWLGVMGGLQVVRLLSWFLARYDFGFGLRRVAKKVPEGLLANWWPPLFVWIGIAMVFCSQFRISRPAAPAWFVWGTTRSYLAAAQVGKDGLARSLCLRGNIVQVDRWRRIADHLGFDNIAAVELENHASNKNALKWLEDRNWIDLRSVDCSFPDRIELRAFLKQCQRDGQRGRKRVIIRAGTDGESPACWSEGRWHTLANSRDS